MKLLWNILLSARDLAALVERLVQLWMEGGRVRDDIARALEDGKITKRELQDLLAQSNGAWNRLGEVAFLGFKLADKLGIPVKK